MIYHHLRFCSYLMDRTFQNSLTINRHHRIKLPISTFSGFFYINLLKSLEKKKEKKRSSSRSRMSVCLWLQCSFVARLWRCSKRWCLPDAWPLLGSSQSLLRTGPRSSTGPRVHPAAAAAAFCSSRSSALWLGPAPRRRPLPVPYRAGTCGEGGVGLAGYKDVLFPVKTALHQPELHKCADG